MRCPKCNAEMKLVNTSYFCDVCDSGRQIDDKFKLNDDVYITFEKHPLFMELCQIIDFDHVFYKVIITCGARKGQSLWVPTHWVQKLPDELRRIRQL